MLEVSALELGAPVTLDIRVITIDLALHLRPAGLHHKKTVSAMNQQAPEAATSGVSCANSRAKAASTAAESIQSCAMLIITSNASRACETAVRPRGWGLFRIP